MITTSENATQKSITLPTRSVHHTSFLWVLGHELVRSTTHRFVAQNGAGLPLPEISSLRAPAPPDAGRSDASRKRGRSGRSPLGQCPQRLGRRLQSGAQQRRIVAAFAGALTAPGGMPKASTAIERLMPCLPWSIGLLPAFSLPQGALVMQQSTATSESLRPMRRT